MRQPPTVVPLKPFLAAVRMKDGKDAWTVDLPSPVVKGGTAVNHQGQIFVSLENGEVRCYAAP